MHFERESFIIRGGDGLLTIQYLIIYDGAGTSEHGRRTPLRAHNVTAQFLRTGNRTRALEEAHKLLPHVPPIAAPAMPAMKNLAANGGKENARWIMLARVTAASSRASAR